MVESKQYRGGYSLQRRYVISKVEDIQYRCVTPSVWKRQIISTVEGMWYGPVTLSIWWRVCSTGLPTLRYFFPSHLFTFYSLIQLLLPTVKLNAVNQLLLPTVKLNVVNQTISI